MADPRGEVLAVPRSKAEAARTYDRISPVYDLEWLFERRCVGTGLDALAPRPGEAILEIGVGTGRALRGIARRVGPGGRAFGLDISPGMLAVTRRRLGRARVEGWTALVRGDGARLPYRPGSFDAVFMSFVLELFDTPEIPAVLGDVRRVLRPTGRVVLVAMSKEGRDSPMGRAYEVLHRAWPTLLDCRPILPLRALTEAGFRPRATRLTWVYGIPVDVVAALPEAA